MCKIFAVTHIETPHLAWRLINAAHPYATARDNDGYGLAWIDAKGRIGGERWTDPDETFIGRKKLPKATANIANNRAFTGSYGRIGNAKALREQPLAILSHARTATSSKGLLNTHPHIHENTALIHNGIVDTHGLDLLGTQCDSAGILWAYLKHSVNQQPKAIDRAMELIRGWYACIVLGKDANGKPYVDFWRSGASMHMGYLPGVGLAWSTTAEILMNAARDAQVRIEGFASTKDDKMLRLMLDESLEAQAAKVYPYHHYMNTGWSSKQVQDYRNMTGCSVGYDYHDDYTSPVVKVNKASDFMYQQYSTATFDPLSVERLPEGDRWMADLAAGVDSTYHWIRENAYWIRKPGPMPRGRGGLLHNGTWDELGVENAKARTKKEDNVVSLDEARTLTQMAEKMEQNESDHWEHLKEGMPPEETLSDKVLQNLHDIGVTKIHWDKVIPCPFCTSIEPRIEVQGSIMCSECWSIVAPEDDQQLVEDTMQADPQQELLQNEG